MSWYTTSAAPFFIDQVQWVAKSGEHLILLVKGKRYEYSVAGGPYAAKIDEWKRRKTPGGKADASKQASQMLRNLEQFRVKPDAVPTSVVSPQPDLPGL